MRYEKGRKDTTRKRIVGVAARRFREDGIAAVGVAGLMADAGLTHGGFYSHFTSKEDLVREAVNEALGETLEYLEAAVRGGGGLPAIIRAYLRPTHRDGPGQGCAVACLVAELGRHPATTRDALSDGLKRFTGLLAEHMPPADGKAREDRAFAIFAAMVGTLQLARAVSDRALSDRILAAGTAAALTLAGCDAQDDDRAASPAGS